MLRGMVRHITDQAYDHRLSGVDKVGKRDWLLCHAIKVAVILFFQVLTSAGQDFEHRAVVA